MRQFRIEPQVFEKIPGLMVGVIVAKNLTNPASSAEILGRLRRAEAETRTRFTSVEHIKEHASVIGMQEAHKAFGSNPNKFPPSVVALIKRVVQGKELPAINTLVDLYNSTSLRHMLPAGGEDLDRCKGDIRLCLADGSESFRTIGATEDEPPAPGEIIYRDDEGAICRKFNWREADRTCLHNGTKNALLAIEAVPPMTRSQLHEALGELCNEVNLQCGARTTTRILSSSSSFCDIA